MANRIENPTNILNEFNELEYVVTDKDIISAMREMKSGEALWYRDYDGTGDKCISLYKRVTRTMYDEQEVFIIAYYFCDDDPTGAVIVPINATDEGLVRTFRQIYEWVPEYHEYQGQMLIDEEVFEHHFSGEE